MKTVYKYLLPLPTNKKSIIELPKGFEIVSLGEQDGEIYVWALVDLNETEKVKKEFRIYGTGQEIDVNISPTGWSYLECVKMKCGLVLHIFSYV